MQHRGAVVNIGARSAPVNEKLLSVKEAAQQLGVSESWLYQSDVPHVKLGRRKLYRPTDLAGYVDARLSHRIASEEI
jgi:hypothetical protein